MILFYEINRRAWSFWELRPVVGRRCVLGRTSLSQELCFSLSHDLILFWTTLHDCVQAKNLSRLITTGKVSLDLTIPPDCLSCKAIAGRCSQRSAEQGLFVSQPPRVGPAPRCGCQTLRRRFWGAGLWQDPTCDGYGQRWPRWDSCAGFAVL